VAAHEKARPLGFDAFDGLPALKIYHAHHALLQVGSRKHGAALIVPGNSRAEMGQAGEVDSAGRLTGVEIHHLPGAIARRADHQHVVLVEKEIVEKGTHLFFRFPESASPEEISASHCCPTYVTRSSNLDIDRLC
jgi:hypothetical protein